MQDSIALETAQLSLEGWMTIEGDVTGGDVWLKQGGAKLVGREQTHTLSVNNPRPRILRVKSGWQFSTPDTRMTMGTANPGRAEHRRQPEPDRTLRQDNKRSDELRIRARIWSCRLEGIRPLAAQTFTGTGRRLALTTERQD
ncbi:hypothetical protein ACVXHB_11505 [Escherichia coli]